MIPKKVDRITGSGNLFYFYFLHKYKTIWVWVKNLMYKSEEYILKCEEAASYLRQLDSSLLVELERNVFILLSYLAIQKRFTCQINTVNIVYS